MFTYLCRQGCPLLTQIKWKNGRSQAISWGTLPVLKWTICSKVCRSSVPGAMRQLCNIQSCSGKVLGADVSELNTRRAPASASSATHRRSSAIGSLWLVGIWGLAEWVWKWTYRTLRTMWGKPLQKVSWTYCEKGDEKLKVKTVKLTIFHHGTKVFSNEEIRPLLLNCSFYLRWKGQDKGRRLGFCLLKTRPKGEHLQHPVPGVFY